MKDPIETVLDENTPIYINRKKRITCHMDRMFGLTLVLEYRHYVRHYYFWRKHVWIGRESNMERPMWHNNDVPAAIERLVNSNKGVIWARGKRLEKAEELSKYLKELPKKLGKES